MKLKHLFDITKPFTYY